MEPPHQPPPTVAWLKATGVRMLKWWPAKAVGISLGMTGFFVAYFWLLRHPRHPPALMPHTAVDRLIGFHPWSLGFYLSLWFYVSLAPALLVVRRELVSYAVAAVGLGVAGLGIFCLWPTTVRWPDADWSRLPAFAFLGSAEATGNACPSLHVAFAVFTAIWLDRLLRQLGAGSGARFVNGCWCVGIMYSTVATREHVALDVLAGGALGAAAAGAHLGWLRRQAGWSKQGRAIPERPVSACQD